MKVKRAIEIRKAIKVVDNLIDDLMDSLYIDYESGSLTDELHFEYGEQWVSHTIDKMRLENEYIDLDLRRSDIDKVNEYFMEEE